MTIEKPCYNKKLYVVTGGNGFLGSFVVDQIGQQQQIRKGGDTAADKPIVALFDISPNSVIGKHNDSIETVFYKTDIGKEDQVSKNLHSFIEQYGGGDHNLELIVYHTASLVSLWIDYKTIHYVNVIGTQNLTSSLSNLLSKDLVQTVKLVYTSTNQVAADFSSNGITGDNLTEEYVEKDSGVREYVYPERYDTYYILTKRLAEKHVLECNGSCDGRLLTTSVRPSGIIWGPHSTVHKQMVLSYKKNNAKVKYSTDVFNTSYVENVAYGHVLCEKAMTSANEKPCGRAYFIGDDGRGNYYNYFTELYEKVGLTRPQEVDPRILHLFSYICCIFCFLINLILPRSMAFRPLFTPFEITVVLRPFHTSHESAAKDFGYKPLVDEKEAMKRTINAFVEWNDRLNTDPTFSEKKIL